MRARATILREIASRNLDPKVVYVAGKDGLLKEKKMKSTGSSADVTESDSEETTQVVPKETIVQEVSNDYIVPETAVRVRDSEKQVFEEKQAEEPAIEQKTTVKKKQPPPKKKKTA
jgi:hypothetical protein